MLNKNILFELVLMKITLKSDLWKELELELSKFLREIINIILK